MALVMCPECGKRISNQAVACPSCGYPIEGKILFEGYYPSIFVENPGTDHEKKDVQLNKYGSIALTKEMEVNSKMEYFYYTTPDGGGKRGYFAVYEDSSSNTPIFYIDPEQFFMRRNEIPGKIRE